MGRRVNLADLAADAVPDTTPTRTTLGVTDLLVADIATNPLNQRHPGEEGPDDLALLGDTIAEHGLVQPLVVATVGAFAKLYPAHADDLAGVRWVALIGNRRLVAAHLAGVERVPALVNDDRMSSMYEVMLVENSHRKDLAPLREAEAMAQVLEQEGLSQRGLAKRVGRTHTYVQQRLALLSLIPSLRAALEDGRLTVERGRDLGLLEAEEQQLISDAGPPYRAGTGGNSVATRTKRPSLPAGDPRAAAKSIRSLYSGDELLELVRLLSVVEEEGESSAR